MGSTIEAFGVEPIRDIVLSVDYATAKSKEGWPVAISTPSLKRSFRTMK